ncbi:MAG: helix-turn-helix transcriptional regulator [Eubacteriales bacterium]
MIPHDAKKPIDLRKKNLSQKMLSSDLYNVIAVTTAPMPKENPDTILDTLGKERLYLQYEGELAYLRGDFARTICCFRKTVGDDAARLRACPVAIAAAISLGDYSIYMEIVSYLKRFTQTGIEDDISAFAELALSTAAVSVIAPNMVPHWIREGEFSALPIQARPNAIYLRAKYFQCISRYEESLAVAQTALTLCTSEETITMTDIYLLVTCTVACCYLGRLEEARHWLIEAMSIALPHGFITPFSEIVAAIGGLMEQCLEIEFPHYRDIVITQWKYVWRNWITFHNRFTNDNITLILTLREYHIALLAAQHVPYVKIAKQYGISVGRLKNIMLGIYEKLFISGREELSQFVF